MYIHQYLELNSLLGKSISTVLVDFQSLSHFAMELMKGLFFNPLNLLRPTKLIFYVYVRGVKKVHFAIMNTKST